MLSFTLSAAVTRIHRLRPKAHAYMSETMPASNQTVRVFHCDQSPELPLPVKVLLNRSYPHWRFPEVSEEDCQIVKENGGPDAHPELIKGDFNDDGLADYAVLIEQDAEANDRGVMRPLIIRIVAFFRNRDGYRMQEVTGEGGGCLQLMPKGGRDFDYEAQRDFTYQHETIFSGFGMGGTSYLYENGKFRAIITSD